MDERERRGRLDDLQSHLRYARPELSDGDVRLLRECLRDPWAEVRRTAIEISCEAGPVTWDDLENWVTDPDEGIREAALLATTCSFAARELCSSDQARYTELLRTAQEWNEQCLGMLSVLMWSEARDNDEALDLTWQAAGQLLDMEIESLTQAITCGYLEDVLVYGHITLEDPRLQAWIKGEGRERKLALLGVAQWFGLAKDWQRQITKMLTRDKNPEVRSAATSLLKWEKCVREHGSAQARGKDG